MSILHAIRRWRVLDRRQRAWLIVFVAALPALRLSLKLRGYRRTRSLIDQWWTVSAPVRQPSRRDVQAADDLAQLAQIAGRRGLTVATCLPQALAVYAAVRRRGLAPALQIGVRKHDNRFEAHAWVELGGTSLAQPELDHKVLSHPQQQFAAPGQESSTP